MPPDALPHLDVTCPECPQPSALGDGDGPLGAARCSGCGGGLISPEWLPALRTLLAGSAPQAGGPEGRTLPCPGCGHASPCIPIEGGTAAPCRQCRSTWLDGPLLAWVETRRRASDRPRPPARVEAAPLPPPADSVRPAAGRTRWLAGMAALVLIGGGGWMAVRTIGSAPAAPAASQATPLVPAPAPAPAATLAPPAAPTVASTSPAADWPSDTLVGGQPVAWWQARLKLLRGGDAEARDLFQATRSRAEANGLTVRDVPGGVEVAPGEALRRSVARAR